MGNIQSANTFASHIFGYSSYALCQMNVSGLMPRPYSRFHAQYLKRCRTTGAGGVPIGETRGRVVSALHKDGRIFTARLEVQALQARERAARERSQPAIVSDAGLFQPARASAGLRLA